MKTILSVISVHSHIDLVTNSSSEVFVGNTVKTVETIKSAIEAIIDAVDGDSSRLWTSMLQEPEISLWTIDAPEKNWDFNRRDPWELEDFKRNNPQPKWPGANATKKQTDEYDKEWKAYREALVKVEDNVFGPARKESEKKILDFYKELCEVNGIDCADLGAPEFYYYGEEATVHYRDSKEELKPFISRVELCMSYGLKISKGDVLIFTQSDNSLSYDYFDIIDRILGGSHYHLG